MASTDEKLHEGHRSRMREKLDIHGERVFLTHELLEMLLYNVIPYRDTNPTAKMLLKKFEGLEGVFRASEEELTEISGVGARTARMLASLGSFSRSLFENDGTRAEFSAYSNYAETGRYIADKLKTEDEPRVLLILLNNRMELITEITLYNTDFASAGVRADAFVNSAVRYGASAALIAHSHPHGAPYPTVGDIETNKLVASALARVGVLLTEHYVVAGNGFSGLMHHLGTAFFQDSKYSGGVLDE